MKTVLSNLEVVVGEYINFPEMVTDHSLGAYDAVAGIYTIPVAGSYAFEIALITNDPTATAHSCRVELRVNNSAQYLIYQDSQAHNNYDSRYLSVTIDFVKDDEVGFYVSQCHAGTKYSTWSYVDGRLIKTATLPSTHKAGPTTTLKPTTTAATYEQTYEDTTYKQTYPDFLYTTDFIHL